VLSGDDYMSSSLFDEREKAVIRWGELVGKNEARYDTETFQTLSKYFDATEIVELTTVAAFRGLMNRFMDSLQIELEGPELQARGGRATASAADLHRYLEQVIALE
jgi:alkylhydroperoxidase family enzyme